MMSRYEISKGPDGLWSWALIQGGKVLASGSGYKTSAGAKSGAEANRRAAKMARVVVLG